MLNFPGPDKILMLAVIALVVLGPSRLPGAARTAGKWIAELRKLTSKFQNELTGALGDPKDAITSAVGDLTKEMGGWRNDVAGFGKSVSAAVTTATAIPAPLKPATWTSAETYAPSTPSVDSVSPALARPGLPSLPPVPDDPSLN